MRMQDSNVLEMLPDAALVGAAVLLLVPDALVAPLDVAVLDADAVVVPERVADPVADPEAVEDPVWVTSPEEVLAERMLDPEGRAELATRTEVDTPLTTDATRTEPLETAAETFDDAADTAEVATAAFDEITETKLDRALVGLGTEMGATVAEAATDARDVADATIWLTPAKAEEATTELTGNV